LAVVVAVGEEEGGAAMGEGLMVVDFGEPPLYECGEWP